MAFTTTTLSAAMSATDRSITITSATGFAAGQPFKIDEEFFVTDASYVAGATIVTCRRGQNGTVAVAHASGANVITGLASDFSSPNASVITSYPLAGRRRKIVSYSASGAIALPVAGEDIIAVLNGTTALAMTIAVPTKDQDGAILYVAGNGAAAHTITFASGLSGSGTSYDVITVNATAPIVAMAMAINGLWNSIVATPMAGTVTAITGTVG